MPRSRRMAWAVAFSLLLAACGGDSPSRTTQATDPPAIGPGSADAADGVLSDLSSIEELRAQFAQDDGSARLVLLLSPTSPT